MNKLVEQKLSVEQQYASHTCEKMTATGREKIVRETVFKTIYPYCQSITRELCNIPSFERNYMKVNVSLNDAVLCIASDYAKFGEGNQLAFGISDMVTMSQLVKYLMPGFSLNVSYMVTPQSGSTRVVGTTELYDVLGCAKPESEAEEKSAEIPDNAMAFVSVESMPSNGHGQMKLF